ncbi:RDD family protein [Subsaximicrobium wynnwilliamsii]|uniref:RDD family protein n=1 Tax=Subsaximicrobium wynnwilliamsii TaxID=291179 RepID=A0A5C6ZD96_9FLAO|nr:RDD family protein [Subsaximicrobium wynnwilliamsii]TXD81909.1 RDD family protein [Subsaximicrobium wynnwilliamsii]TXD87028.1 RDD family protein [Subsaximicrobium wynnwilliamsii]TXE01360.1 RDD family protein [Subsaximicrobium wynnwilliamsii]
MNSRSITITTDLLASKGKRFGNFIVDYIIQMIIGAGIGVVIALMAELTGDYALYDIVVESESRLMDYVFGFGILFVYYVIIESLTSKSIGKYITQTKVVLEDGSKPGFSDILLRTLCRLIPFEQFSFLGTDGKGWHDSLSKTYVVDEKKYEAKKDTVIGLEEIGRAVEV